MPSAFTRTLAGALLGLYTPILLAADLLGSPWILQGQPLKINAIPASGLPNSTQQVEHASKRSAVMEKRTSSNTFSSDRSPFVVESTSLQNASQQNTNNLQCSDEKFRLSDQALLDEIKEQGFKCVERLFSAAPYDIRRDSFSQQNLLTVAKEAKQLSISYDGTDTGHYLSSLYYWIKAFYFHDNRALLNQQNQNATQAALDALFSNRHVFDNTEANARVINDAAANLNNGLIAHHYMPFLTLLMNKYNGQYEETTEWGAAFATISWDVLYYCAIEKDCRQSFYNNQLVAQLSAFIKNNLNWLDKPANDYHLHNLAYQLGNMYTAKHDVNFGRVQTALASSLTNIFTQYGPLQEDTARRAYLSALSAVNYHQQCSTFTLCDKTEEIICDVLNNRINCPSGTLFMWAQDMTPEQLAWACNSLKSYEEQFHTRLQTQKIPVTPDDNQQLRMVVFNDAREWGIYGYVLFGASTDNVGLYLDGDPAKEGDQATFFAYENVYERPTFDIWNLRHEYIHYLDGRFISHGDFQAVNGTGRTVWYGEGLAEYLSKYECYDDAITEAKLGSYSLSTIFQNEYGVGQTRIYRWGYLAVRFMFERRPTEFKTMLNHFRSGSYQDYRNQMVDKWVRELTYDLEFSQWLKEVKSTGCQIDSSRPTSPIPPVDIDTLQ